MEYGHAHLGLRAGPPSRVLELPSEWRTDATYGLPRFAASPDGQHFYVVHESGPPPALRRIHVVLNWLDEFKQRVAK